ncbi:MAG: TonB-dependent receptor [Longimicrobiales bacterium]|nr:TonB-dependent receptor [Longimicrobiales bacterium]
MSPIFPWILRPALPWGRSVPVCLMLLGLSTQGPPPIEGQFPESGSAVRGQVLEHETGTPLAGAAVSLASGPGGTKGIGTRVTNSEGNFFFRQVPPGTYRVIVTLIGYQDLQDTLRVGLESDLELSLPLSVSPVRLEPLVIVADRRNPGIMGDFERRRRTRPGAFFDREDIETRQPMLLTDLLRMVPGARVVPTSPYDYTVRLRGDCQPALWVDGMQLITEEGMNDILPTMDLEAVEVYHGASLPVEFGSNSCGAIVVWTRRGEPNTGTGNFWRKLAFAAGFSLLALLLAR